MLRHELRLTSILPYLADPGADLPVAYRAGIPVARQTFVADIERVAACLPEARFVLNACEDRYRFAVGLGAAMVRNQVSVLPNNLVAATLADLALRYPGIYALCDGATELAPLRCLGYPDAGPDAFRGNSRNGDPVVGPNRHADASPDAGRGAGSGADPPPEQLRRRPWDRVPAFPADQPFAHLFTSGSTGAPVAHPRSWGSAVASARAEAARLGLSRTPHAILGTVPAQHSYGLESTVLLALQSGSPFVAERPFYPADIFAALARLPRPRLLVTTPVHLRAMLAATGELPPADLLLSATAALAVELAESAEARFGAPLLEIYGSTESGQVASRRTTAAADWEPLADVVLTQRAGITWAAGGHVETPTALADLIELAGGGRFRLQGRPQDLVNIAGKRTSIAFLDRQLGAIDGVEDAAFLMPGEREDAVVRLSAFVVAPGLSSAQILSALATRIDPVFLPRPLHRVARLPRAATGKLPRERLLELARSLGVPATGSTRARVIIPADAPYLDGHFPGRPIVPGAKLLERVIATLQTHAGLRAGGTLEVPVVKFLVPVAPGSEVNVDWRPGRDGAIEFECHVGAQRVAHGRVRPGNDAATAA